jgi:hypothetical protein
MAKKVISFDEPFSILVKAGDILVIRYPIRRANSSAPSNPPSLGITPKTGATVSVNSTYTPIDKVTANASGINPDVNLHPWPNGPVTEISETKDNSFDGWFSAIVVQPTGGDCIAEGGS